MIVFHCRPPSLFGLGRREEVRGEKFSLNRGARKWREEEQENQKSEEKMGYFHNTQ